MQSDVANGTTCLHSPERRSRISREGGDLCHPAVTPYRYEGRMIDALTAKDSDPQDGNVLPLVEWNGIGEIVGLACACGALETGGPLSARERALADKALPAGKAAAARIRSAIRNGEDPLGDALCRVRCARDRRPLGAFYTNLSIINPMVSWALDQHPETFVDPGSGSGRFSVAAAMRSRRVAIVAVDLDPIAALISRAALAAVGARQVTVINGDFLRVRLRLGPGVAAFVGNPPYVRHHGLSPETKRAAARLASNAGYTVSKLAGLHALFYLATLAKHGRQGDVGSFVTSAEWLDVGYGSIIRSMFTKGLGGNSVTLFDPRSVPFDDAMTTAAISTFRIGHAGPTSTLRKVQGRSRLMLGGRGRVVGRKTLECAKRWSPLFSGEAQAEPTRTIGAIFNVSRGQVTGANSFFVMTRDEAKQRGVEGFCTPVITRAEEILASDGVVRDVSGRMVALTVPRDLDVRSYPKLAAYISAGEAAGVHRGYVTSRRRPWYALTFRKPPIVATYMARQAPKFARNPNGLGTLNVVHGLYPRQPIEDAALDAVVSELNGARRHFVGRGRTYHGGLEKFEPSEMANLPLRVLH